MRDLRKYDLETRGLLEIADLRVKEEDFAKEILRRRFRDYDYTDSGHMMADDLGKATRSIVLYLFIHSFIHSSFIIHSFIMYSSFIRMIDRDRKPHSHFYIESITGWDLSHHT